MFRKIFAVLFIVTVLTSVNLLIAQEDNINDLYNSFKRYYNSGDFINAERCLLNSLVLKEPLSKEYKIVIYNNLGAINIRLGRYDEALKYLNQAESIIGIEKNSSRELADIYINKARIYGITKESDKAIDYLEQGIKVYLDNYKPDKSILFRLSTAYLNLGLTYFEKADYNLALLYLEKSRIIKQNNNLPETALTYLNLAKTYAKISNNENTQKFFLKSIESFFSEFGEGYYRLVDVYFDYGLFLRSIGKNSAALEIHKKALAICLKNYGNRHTFISLAYKHLGDNFFFETDYQAALGYYQKSLIAVVSDFNSLDILTNPSLNSVLFNIRLLDNLKQKAKALELFSQQQSDLAKKQQLLAASLETAELAIQLIQRIRSGYLSTESRIYLSENEKETYFEAVRIARDLYELTNKQAYLNKMYTIACLSKSSVLRNEIRENELMKGKGINDSVKENRDNLAVNIASYSKLIQDELQRKEPDATKIDFWKSTLFDLNRRKDRANEKLKVLYPQYDAILQKTQPTSLAEIQSHLKKGVTIIEYLLSNQFNQGKRELFIFTITKSSIKFSSTFLDSNHSRQMDRIRYGTSYNFADSNQSYVNALHYMYQQLIKPVEKYISGNKIIIVPDEELAYLPFEAFIKEEANFKKQGFDGLKYLIYDYTFSYGYTSSLIFNSRYSRSNNYKIFAFSPDYSADKYNNNERYNTLNGAGQEISSIFKWFKGDIYRGVNATEYNFKHLMKRPAIYHLAMHSKADSNNSKYSYFIFDNQADTIDDGKLFNYELSNSIIESPMVVLSACSTGSGSLYHGEGVMSLTRGCILAGASSVVSTFWDVNDDASATIITDFYYHLSKGKAKDEALRLAKLDYLRTTPPTYTKPMFWAAYAIIGDSSPIKNNRKNLVYYALIIIAGIVIFYFIRSRSF